MRRLGGCVLAVLLGLAVPARAQVRPPAAHVVRDENGHARGVWGAAIATGTSDPASAARAVLAQLGASLGLTGEWAVEDVVEAHGYHVVHARRRVLGRPVVNAPIVVRVRPDGQVDWIDVSPVAARVEPFPAVDRSVESGQVALSVAGYGQARIVSSALVPFASADAVVPAYEVEVAGRARTERARVIVDARSGEVLALEPLALDVLGRVYPQNAVSDAMHTMDLPLAGLTSTTNLVGTYARVASCDQLSADCTTVQHAVADVDGNFLFDPVAHTYDDAFAEVSAYHHVGVVVDYMAMHHGFTWSCGGNARMNVFVNYTEMPNVPFDNAAFMPGDATTCGYLVFGQGSADDYAWDGDVVYHEYGHAVTSQITDLGYFSPGPSPGYQPLAINEGTSDYWAAAVQGDPVIGESITSLEGSMSMGGLRTIDNTLACPNDLFGEGHFDGRMWSGLGWAVRGILGQDRADALFYTAVATVSGSATISMAVSALVSAAMSEVSMGHVTSAELAAIQAAVTARGLADCAMNVPLDDGHEHTGYSGNAFVTATIGHGVAPLQYSIQIPPDATAVEVLVGHATFYGQSTVHFMNGQPVRASISRIVSDRAVPVGRSGSALYTVDQGLVRCGTLYVAVETTDIRSGESLYAIRASVMRTGISSTACPPPPHDAGPRDAGTDTAVDPDAGADAGPSTPPSSGCGCRVGHGRGEGALGLALVWALVARRRRARR
jgi:Zn-dependent metalloprotease